MSTQSIFAILSSHMKRMGLTYKDIAKELGVSHVTVRRIFSDSDCSLSRLKSICEYLQIDMRSLLPHVAAPENLLKRLTWEQEAELVQNLPLFIVSVCVLSLWRFEEILDHFTWREQELIRHFARLDRLGFLRWQKNNRYKLMIAQEFSWIADGPIMRFVRQQTTDYFDHTFEGDGELFRIMNVRVSRHARKNFKVKLEGLLKDFAMQVNADAAIPLEERPPLSICIASRQWIPSFFVAHLRPRNTSTTCMIAHLQEVMRQPNQSLTKNQITDAAMRNR